MVFRNGVCDRDLAHFNFCYNPGRCIADINIDSILYTLCLWFQLQLLLFSALNTCWCVKCESLVKFFSSTHFPIHAQFTARTNFESSLTSSTQRTLCNSNKVLLYKNDRMIDFVMELRFLPVSVHISERIIQIWEFPHIGLLTLAIAMCERIEIWF